MTTSRGESVVLPEDGSVIGVTFEKTTGRIRVEHVEFQEWIFDLRPETARRLARAMLKVADEAGA